MSWIKDKIPFLDHLPMGWEIKRLKDVANIYLSNVDKKSVDGEELVKLCNYVDVYYNHTITNEIDFMVATASKEQIKKLTLQKDDVILTKDSESPLDIGIPTWVETEMPGVVCGYHLSLIRTKKEKLDGLYLYYLLSSFGFKEHFWISAKGVTRFGISKGDIQNIQLVIPPLDIQRKLASYLKKQELLSEELISKKNRLIQLLEKQRQSMITEAVTKGLNPNVKMKDSGVEWIGEIPEHWKKSKLKYVTRQIIDGTHHTPNYKNSGIPFLRVTDITKSKGKEINLEEVKYISKDEHLELIKRCNPENGDLLVSKNGTIGVPKVIDWSFEFSIFVSLCLIKLKTEKLNPNFCSYFFESDLVEEQIASGSKKSTIVNLHLDKIKEFIIFLPPLEKQEEIVETLNAHVKEYDELIWKIQNQIQILKDYRQSLIYEAVTGKIDVRDIEIES